ncbi:type IV secretion system protein VirB4 [Xanthomonas citri pv. aurantifolii str. ICPB 11122]|nr:type IV secretion system protein VirB4 [Xanthomonas citri pv. aurantifolii str. ICPB 11122]
MVQTLSGYGARKLRIQRRPEFVLDRVSRADAQVAVERFKMSWQEFQRSHGHHDVYRRDEVLDYLGEDFTEIGGFLHYLVNLEDERVPVTEMQLDRTLAVSSLDFKMVSNMMAVQNLSGTRAGAMLSTGMGSVVAYEKGRSSFRRVGPWGGSGRLRNYVEPVRQVAVCVRLQATQHR